jgi:dTDP-glucose pyrophosphorylase/CBS domain-containing protein
VSVDLDQLLLAPTATIRDAMQAIDRAGTGIALVVDAERRLLATISDGDIRRAILGRIELDSSIAAIVASERPRPEPLTAPLAAAADELLHLMTEHELRQIPLVDEDGRVAAVARLEDLVRAYELPLRAVVMAGGFGARLGDLTESLPKPMLPLGDRPLLEHIIGQLRDAGIHRVKLTTHYLANTIESHFGDGHEFGVAIEYLTENEPLGTAGALGQLEAGEEPVLVMNGDLVTRVDFRALLDFHREHDADLTVAVRPYEVRVPFGVVETAGADVRAIDEKPLLKGFVNAGIYLLDPHVLRHVPPGEPFEMPDLIREVIARGGRVVSFPLHEHWLDIGEVEAYRRALAEHAEAGG